MVHLTSVQKWKCDFRVRNGTDLRADWHACFNASDLKGKHTLNIIYNDILHTLIFLTSTELHNKTFLLRLVVQFGFNWDSVTAFSVVRFISIDRSYCGK